MNIDDMFGRDENFYRIAELNRRATTLGDSGHLPEAVDCLMKAAQLGEAIIDSCPTEGIRLALYLQKAGRGNEATHQMQRLISKVPDAVNLLVAKGKPASLGDKAAFEANQYALLFDKLRLILQREKEKTKSDAYKHLAQQWQERTSALYQRQVMKARVTVPARPLLE